MKPRLLLTIAALLLLPSCALTDGLALSYTKRFGTQDLTAFYGADGTYGILGKTTGKAPVPTAGK